MNLIRKLGPKSAFGKNVVTLVLGTSLAQAIPIAISPILTRLYTPNDFGVFSVYMAASSLLSVMATGRYELATMLPQKDSHALNITALAVTLTCTISAILLVIVLLFSRSIAALLGFPTASAWLYLIPASTLFSGLYQSLNYWNNRKGNFTQMASSRMVLSGSAAAAHLVGGLTIPSAPTLLGGQIVGQAAATAAIAWDARRNSALIRQTIHPSRMLAVARRYSRFPKYVLLGQLGNVASGQMLLFLLNIFCGPSIAGFYALSQRTLSAPLSLVGAAIGDVFRRQAAKDYNTYGNCKTLYRQTQLRLIIFSATAVTPVLLFGPSLFSLVFGIQWRAAGEIASILAVMVFFQTVSTPLSQTVWLADMQAADLLWQFVRFFLSIVSFLIGYRYFMDYKIAIALHAASFATMYIVHSIMQARAAQGRPVGRTPHKLLDLG